jgi:hypothetical protein
MYGFQPKAQRKPVQQFADGGLVDGFKRALGFKPQDPARAAALAEYRANSAREREAAKKAAAAPAPAPAAITQYSGMSAMQRREKEQGLANGGMIRGPGTGTSDSIPDEMEPGTFIMPADSTQALGLDDEAAEGEKVPVRVSNGEYELPPERVQAIGAAVLDAIKGVTHAPTGQGDDEAAEGEQPMALGFKPRGEPQQFFNDGGRVKTPEEQARLQNQTSMYVQGAQAAAANRPPERPANKPVAATKDASPTGLYIQDRVQEMRDQVGAGNYAQAAGTALRTSVQGLPMYGIEMADKAATPVLNAAVGFGRGLFGSDDAAQPPAAPTASAAPAAPAATVAGGARGVVNPPAVDPSAAPAAPSAAPSSSAAIAPGVYRNAPGQYSDTPTGTALPGGITAQPSTQNMAASDSLAPKSSSTPAMPVAAGFPGANGSRGVTAPTVRNSTNDWQARNNLRNLEVSASSITNNGGRWDKSGKGDSAAMAAYKAALATDQALQQAQPVADVTAMRENAGIQREDMQQTGATTRTGMQEAGANARDANRINLAGQELSMKREAQGFQTRAAQQLENLQNAYTTEKDPVKQAALARQIRGLQGKSDPADWAVQVTPTTKNADGSTTEGSVIRYNKSTGQAERVDLNGGAQASPYKEGQRLQGKDGKAYVVKNGVPVPA